MIRTFLPAVAGVALTLGCAPPPPTELSDADRDAIRQYLDDVAQNLSPEDNEAWANGFTEDAIMMFPNTPTIRGRQALQAWGEDTSETGSPVALSASFSDIEIHGGGDWAWVTTGYTLRFEGFEGPDHGKQLLVLERQPDDSWLAAAVHASSDLPLADFVRGWGFALEQAR